MDSLKRKYGDVLFRQIGKHDTRVEDVSHSYSVIQNPNANANGQAVKSPYGNFTLALA